MSVVQDVVQVTVIPFLSCSILKVKILQFWRNFRFTAKLRREYGDFPYTPLPAPSHTCDYQHMLLSHHINNHQSGTFVKIDEPTMTCHDHPNSMVYMVFYSWHDL